MPGKAIEALTRKGLRIVRVSSSTVAMPAVNTGLGET
jgi:hypothetical protein